MGLDASFTVIPLDEFRKYRKDPMHYIFPDTLAKIDLYREWDGLDLALQKMKSPLSLAIRGDQPEGEAYDKGWDAYFAFVTAPLVKKINKALTAVSEEELIAALKEAGLRLRKNEHKDYIGALKGLKAAYRAAAKIKGCLSILIS
ncbi:MAG: YfbM family protein [Gemmataceae bacterium]|nr:YfbM family protein [Gemmataceae bacterium]